MSVAIYGPKSGYNSFEVVTRGFEEGATANKCFAGRVSHDTTSEDEHFGVAWEADTAICTGAYSIVRWMRQVGQHKRHYVMLAPNSSWIPAEFWQHVHVDGVLTPSEWGKKVIMEHEPDVPVYMVPHGLLNGHGPIDKSDTASMSFNRDGRFLISHFAGSSLERKGTHELLKAFSMWPRKSESHLILMVNPIEWKTMSEEVESMGETKNVSVITRVNAPPQVMRRLYASSDLVCQPSRAEGFGLVPLEALAAGTPVAMTVATGHAQYALQDGVPIDGVIQIPVGPEADVMYDPGGLAPSIDPYAIMDALEDAFSFSDVFRAKAASNAENLLNNNTWERVTKPFFELVAR